jgi:multidrug efflux pump subunit AcrB
MRIEERLEGIEGIDTIGSYSAETVCTVIAELFESADPSKALDEIKNQVDSITTFPSETEKPITSLVNPKRKVLDLSIMGPTEERELKELAERIRYDLTQLKGLSQAEIAAVRPYEISIEVSEESLRRHDLSFQEVAIAVRKSSLDVPGGNIKTSSGDILLRTTGQAYSGMEFENLIVRTRADGTRIYLRDIAKVVDGFADTDLSFRFNNKPAALITVSRVGDEDIQEISQAAKDYVSSVSVTLPKNWELAILQDRLDTLIGAALQGFLMVLILLALFLRPRLAFWVSLGVPVAFLGALTLANLVGLSIDAISLFGFILVLGILVDDAIVIGESIHSRHQRGEPLLEGSIKGAQEVAVPVIFGVLTTVTAFMPIMFASGFMGQIGYVIATTVLCCLLFSIVESQLILPAHLGHSNIKKPEKEVALMLVPVLLILIIAISASLRQVIGFAIFASSGILALHYSGHLEKLANYLIEKQSGFSAGFEKLVNTRFKDLSERTLKKRYQTIAWAIFAFVIAIALLGSGRLPFSFFPPLASDQVIAKLTMPLGTNAEITKAGIDQLEESASRLAEELKIKYPEANPVIHLASALGSTSGENSRNEGSHLGEVILGLTPSQTREIKTIEVANRWRELTGPVSDALELKFNSSLFSSGEDIDIQLEGNDVDALASVAKEVREKLAEYPGVIDITDSFRSGKREMKLSILPSGEALGLTLSDLARQVRQAFYGEEAQRVQRGREDIRVMIRYPEDERGSLDALSSMRIRTPDGNEVPFSTVATAEHGIGFSTIRRSEGKRIVNVIASVDRSQVTANEVIADLRSGPIQKILAPHPSVSFALEGEQKEQAESMASLIPLFIFAMVVIYALLAIPLNSYFQPLIIMSVIPFAFVGAIFGHWIMMKLGLVAGIAMMSIQGFVAAAGVVVNSSLILVHSINFRRKEGEEIREAVTNSSLSRCRPIMLTSITTFVGLLPLMLNTSVQAQFLVPMAASLAFGVLFSTIVTLLVVPSGYLILDDIGAWLARKTQSERSPTSFQ